MKYVIWHILSLHVASVHVLQNIIANFPKICIWIHVYYKRSHNSQIINNLICLSSGRQINCIFNGVVPRHNKGSNHVICRKMSRTEVCCVNRNESCYFIYVERRRKKQGYKGKRQNVEMSRKLGRNEIEEEYDKMIKVYYKQVWKHCNETTLYNSYRLIK